MEKEVTRRVAVRFRRALRVFAVAAERHSSSRLRNSVA